MTSGSEGVGGAPTAGDRPLLTAVRDFLERDGWDVEAHPDEPVLRTRVEGSSGAWSCFARTREDELQITVHSICPRAAPEPTRAAVAEFLTRVNFGLVIGNFELDLDDGEVRFKTSADVEDEPVSDIRLRKLMSYNVHSMDTHLPLLEDLIDARTTPREAMERLAAA